jgi:hypothetical protein
MDCTVITGGEREREREREGGRATLEGNISFPPNRFSTKTKEKRTK